MRTERKQRGFLVYEMEWDDRVQQAVECLARMQAAALSDEAACRVGALFPRWEPGVEYQAGERIADGTGNPYRVVQGHTSQADWPIDATPALYTPLGLTEEEPDAVPEWVQPTGAHDAYQTGDRVRYEGVVYRSLVDHNVWVPGESDAWEAEDSTQR